MDMAKVKQRLAEIGSSQRELAKFMGVDFHAVGRLVNGGRVRVSQAEVDAIRRFFEMREKPVYEAAAEEEPVAELRPRSFRGTATTGRIEIPLFGGIDTPDGFTLSLAAFAQVGKVLSHPGQISARKPFAVEVIDDTMSPRFEQGEIAYVTAGAIPRRGQDCLVEFTDLTAKILQYVDRSDRQVIFRQLNPLKQLSRPAGEKLSIHAIVGRG